MAEQFQEREEKTKKAPEAEAVKKDQKAKKSGKKDQAVGKPIDISIVLDRSGSMGMRRAEAIDSFNSFLMEQRGVPGKARLSLVQFNHRIETVHEGVKLGAVPDLTEEQYVPSGSTALLDAIGRTALEAEKRLKKRAKKRMKRGKAVDAPDVVFVVITDGLENASRQFSHSSIRDLITRLEKDHNWMFVFLGTTQESVVQAGDLGLERDRVFAMGSSRSNYRDGQQLVSGKIRTVRELRREQSMALRRQSLAFTDAERSASGDRHQD